MTLLAYTKENTKDLLVVNFINKYCNKYHKNINELFFKYRMVDLNLEETFEQLINNIEDNTSRINISEKDIRLNIDEKYKEIDILDIDKFSFIKKYKTLLIILISIIILIILLIIIVVVTKKNKKKQKDDNEELDNGNNNNLNNLDTTKEEEKPNDTTKEEERPKDTTKETKEPEMPINIIYKEGILFPKMMKLIRIAQNVL